MEDNIVFEIYILSMLLTHDPATVLSVIYSKTFTALFVTATLGSNQEVLQGSEGESTDIFSRVSFSSKNRRLSPDEGRCSLRAARVAPQHPHGNASCLELQFQAPNALS